MALVVASNTGFDAINAQRATKIDGLFADAAIPAGVACIIQADGSVVASNGTAATAAAAVAGINARAALDGEPVTLFNQPGLIWQWTDVAGTLTPGALYFIAASATGEIDDTATTGDTVGAYMAVSDTDLQLVRVGGQA